MEIINLHPWDVTIEQAKHIQSDLLKKIDLRKLKHQVKLIAGADVSYSKKLNRCFAIVIVLKFPELEVVEEGIEMDSIKFPYIPGYLTFREAPVLLKAFEKIMKVPDMILFDGQGIAHPRSMGIAAHMGVILNLPTIGCAKKRLVGDNQEVAEVKGSQAPLNYKGEIIGAVVRTRSHVKPVFVSPGNLITIEESIGWVLKTSLKYRIPEPIRMSHVKINKLRASYE